MSHHTYSTESFVLGGVPSGESNRFVFLLTRDLGLVRALGKNLRGERSKLRYHLQPYSWVHATLVRGRDVWRLTGASDSENLYRAFAERRDAQRLMARTCSLLLRLLPGEEADPALFALFRRGLVFLKETPISGKRLRDFEYLFVIRILALLGYVGDDKTFSRLLEPEPFSDTTLDAMSSYRTHALRAINQALEASGL